MTEEINMNIFGTLTLAQQLVFCLRMLLAAACGGCIGYERSRRAKGAGIRTHMVVCMGAALMMIISKYGFLDIVFVNSIQADASRIASNIVTGISFLGAGVIFVKHNATIQGLTTAAGIWATAGIGMAMGAGMYLISAFATILLMALQLLLHRFLTSYDNNFLGEAIIVTSQGEKDVAKELEDLLRDYRFQLQKTRVRQMEDGRLEYRIFFKTMRDIPPQTLAELIRKDGDIRSIEL